MSKRPGIILRTFWKLQENENLPFAYLFGMTLSLPYILDVTVERALRYNTRMFTCVYTFVASVVLWPIAVPALIIAESKYSKN